MPTPVPQFPQRNLLSGSTPQPSALQIIRRAAAREDRKIGSRRASCHLTRILLMAWCVGNDELALRRGKVSIRNYSNALFAFCSQSVREQCKVDLARRRVDGRPLYRGELIVIYAFGIEE
jgi:hypothetical protein